LQRIASESSATPKPSINGLLGRQRIDRGIASEEGELTVPVFTKTLAGNSVPALVWLGGNGGRYGIQLQRLNPFSSSLKLFSLGRRETEENFIVSRFLLLF